MKTTLHLLVCVTVLSLFSPAVVRAQKSQAGGLPDLAHKVAALERLVSLQSNHIAALTQAVATERAARLAADAALQAQINAIQPPLTGPELAGLVAFARVVAVAETNVYVAGNLCVGGNVALPAGNTLFASRVQPSDGGCGGNPAGVTLFSGNVAVFGTNTLFVNTLRGYPNSAPPAEQADEEPTVVTGPLLQRQP